MKYYIFKLESGAHQGSTTYEFEGEYDDIDEAQDSMQSHYEDASEGEDYIIIKGDRVTAHCDEIVTYSIHDEDPIKKPKKKK